MSNRFDLLCVDHGARLHCSGNNWGIDAAWAVIDSADLICELLAHPGNSGSLSVAWLGVEFWTHPHGDDTHLEPFLLGHRGCQMVPVSEYDGGYELDLMGGRVHGPNRRLVDGRRRDLEDAVRACAEVYVGDGDLDPVEGDDVRDACVAAIRALERR